MKIIRNLGAFYLLTLFLISSIGNVVTFSNLSDSTEMPDDYPLVYVYPEIVSAEIGETFTISVVVYNLTKKTVPDPDHPTSSIELGNLYGFDIQFSWDHTVIQYVNYSEPGSGYLSGATGVKGYRHTNVTAPVEKYPNPVPPSPYAGVLHGSGSGGTELMEVSNLVNETGNLPGAVETRVRAWFVYATIAEEEFNGNGTLFTMTFKVLKKGESPLEIVDCTLASLTSYAGIGKKSSGEWLNPPRNGVFRLGAPVVDFDFWPSIGVINKPVQFNASVTENLTLIETFMWDFDDGTRTNTTVPTVEHSYTSADEYFVSLKAVDASGVESASVSKKLIVAQSRDLKATSLSLSQDKIRPNTTIGITARIDNLGVGPDFVETSNVTIYYNSSLVDLQNPQSSSWIKANSSQTTIGKGTYKLVQFAFNSSLLPTIETDYYFLVNVTGIPEGYEANTTNNIKLSISLLYTNQTVHEPKITTFDYGFLRPGTSVPKPPVIDGEDTTFNLVIKNEGSDVDSFNVTLYANSSLIKTKETLALQPGGSETIAWSYRLGYGYYNLTVEAKAENTTDVISKTLRVVKTPQLTVEYSPEAPSVNQEVTFNSSKSIHQDPTSTITNYLWKIYAPGVDPTTGSPVKTFTGANLGIISYALNRSGVWTVVLDITDNNNLKYDSRRSSTDAYRITTELTVGETGFPIEYIIIIVVIVVAVVAAVVVLLMRRRRPKMPVEE